jgi:uncharacterized protein
MVRREFRRLLDLTIPAGQSAFLWGARKTGKSTYLRATFPDSLRFDLLETDVMLELTKRPSLLRERLLAAPPRQLQAPVIIDEVQKVPQLLDEVHWLIENKKLRFILCGSSARKLRRGRVNLLGGRAWRYEMHPLVSAEVPDLDLPRALNRGLVPAHYLETEYRRSLDAYVRDYLAQEVFDEGLTRNVPAFARFFDAMAYSHGELTNFANIARDCGVDAKTVKEYYQILVDITAERGEQFGRAFEHFILMELLAHRSYRDLDYDIHFWRTKSGLEVDFILGHGEVAIEVKGASRVDHAEFRALRAFVAEHRPRRALMVCNERSPRVHDGIDVLPWREFLARLWGGQILS